MANPFTDQASYLGNQTKGSNYLPWEDYNSLWSQWNSRPTGVNSMGYGEGNPQFTGGVSNLYNIRAPWSYSVGGAENPEMVDNPFSWSRDLTDKGHPGYSASIDPYTGQITGSYSTHGEGGGFLGGLVNDLGPLALMAVGANYLPGMFGAEAGVAGDAFMPANIAQQGALDLGVGSSAGSLYDPLVSSSIGLDGVSNATNFGSWSAPVAGETTGTNLLQDALHSSLGDGLGAAADADLAAGLDPSLSYDAFMTANPVSQSAMSSALGSKALFPGLEALFSDKGFIGQNKNLLSLLGTGYSIYSNGQKADALKDLTNQQNNLAQQNINAQKATQDTLMNAYNNMYAPGSPEYNQMQQTIARQDAQAGRNSQYGPRAESLAAKIAGIKGNLLPQIMSAASSGTNQAYASALSAMNSSLNPAMQAANTSSSQLAPLFAMFGQASQQNNGVQSDPQTLMKIIQMMTQKNT